MTEPTDISPKVTQMPGVRMSPETLLARLLERAIAGDFKSILVSVEWEDDGSFNASYSFQKTGTVFLHSRTVAKAADDSFYGDDPDNIEVLDEGA